MTKTPLCDALRAFADQAPLRQHMPGHHGKPLPLPELRGYAAIDFTELPPTGDLFSPGGPIEEAEELWARAYGMAACLFLTGGSTQGIHASMALCCRPGDEVLIDRGSHRSVYNALGLLDLRPHYLTRPWREESGVMGPISPQVVENYLTQNPKIKTVCITSPTYYGVLSDIGAIADIVHAHGGKLVVDGAHGAHLPFLGENPYRDADLVTVSAHKTLPAPGQTALLFSNGSFHLNNLRWGASLCGSSSPSYPLMAALDALRAYMEEEGKYEYRRLTEQVGALRKKFSTLSAEIPQDPTRFVLCCRDGFAVQQKLEKQNLWPEMADTGHVVFLPSIADSREELEALSRILSENQLDSPTHFQAMADDFCDPPPLPEQVVTPREALFAPRREVALKDAEGLVSAVQVAPYPPGIPIIAPGERVDKKQLSYLSQIEYNVQNKIGIL
ncbi:MAG: aminotransferase class V-fold PLP-dependent enzyme [Clostridia bacterium]|nr:aminotransferase class V-fold PLP-dependent enzyme [Clostridia bacterium]